ncbi:MAG: hypothetical protein EOO43_01600 [Flavobacterium sp.]|nr:MAG: hypothetical protein EOO43_01600 [Flavobacterium sp.]
MIEVSLNNKPIPVPIKFQPIYKVILLLAILKYGTIKPYNATFLKLHLYMWGLRDDSNLQILLDIKNKRRNSITPWIFELALEKTVTLGIINKLCKREIKSGELQICLEQKGLDLLEKIQELKIFETDINKIKSVGIIPQARILTVNKTWEIF